MTRKDDRIQALEAELEKQRNLTETLQHSIKNSAEIDKARADFHRKESERAEEQAKLKNIREGLIPVDEIRGLIRDVRHQYSDRQHPRTDIEIVASNPTKIEQAIIDALTEEKPNYSAGGYIPVRNSSFDNLGRVIL